MWLSKCCDSPVIGENIADCICLKCKEHCDCYDDEKNEEEEND